MLSSLEPVSPHLGTKFQSRLVPNKAFCPSCPNCFPLNPCRATATWSRTMTPISYPARAVACHKIRNADKRRHHGSINGILPRKPSCLTIDAEARCCSSFISTRKRARQRKVTPTPTLATTTTKNGNDLPLFFNGSP